MALCPPSPVPRLLLVALIFPLAAAAQPSLPLLDSDNFTQGFRGPSMAQSLEATASFYELSHEALQRHFGDRERSARSAVALFDLATLAALPTPLSDVWLHEEWHRAVLGNRGVGSFDDVYRFRPFVDAVAVSRVRDDALAAMKRDHPADFVRASEAGVEAEAALVMKLEKEHFYRGAKSWDLALYWFVKANSIGYIVSGSRSSTDRTIDKWERDEGADVRRRDFIGHDFTAWVYDLFRPDEPYAARGVHPSGVGIRRYVRVADLTPAERAYLRKQGRLSFINLLDPNLAGVAEIRPHMNVTASHTLTSFGYAVGVHLFAPRALVTIREYANHERRFPGVEIELPRAAITPRIALWLQPANQRFDDRAARAGALATVRIARRHTFAELEAKTAGWSQGNVHLGKSIAVRAGFLLPH